MPQIIINQQAKISHIEAAEGEVLLNVLRDRGFDVYAPCGGNGTCGKCRIFVKGEGIITSCIYIIKDSIELVLPDKREAKVLVAQHKYTITVNPW